MVMSLRCVPPAKGSLTTTWSPGPSSPAYASIAARTDAGIEPRCTGMCSACASSSPAAVNTAAEQSARSLMFGLDAERRSTVPISSAIPPRREMSTWSAAGSRLTTAPVAAPGSPPRQARPTSPRGSRSCSRVRRPTPVRGRPGRSGAGRSAWSSTLGMDAVARRATTSIAMSARANPLRRRWAAWKSATLGTVSSWLCPAYRQSTAVVVAAPAPTSAAARAASADSAGSRPGVVLGA